jgi:hypothetical protein
MEDTQEGAAASDTPRNESSAENSLSQAETSALMMQRNQLKSMKSF